MKTGNASFSGTRTHKARLLLRLSTGFEFRLPLLKLKFHAEPDP